MLLDVEKFADQFTRRHVTKRIAGILHSLTRETDIKGWYKYDYVVGVILADTSAAGAERLRAKLRHKLSEALRKEEFYGVGVSIHVFPEDAGEKEQDAEPETAPDMALYPDLTSPGRRRLSLMAKRAIDFVGAIAGLVIFSPLFLLIPALIKLTSKGPVLFRQERMGQFEKKFTFLKFRTMYVGNDPSIHKEFVKKLICDKDGCRADDGSQVYKIHRDPRVTPLGRILRKTSLDELPQFLNVLKGEMSLVGPRPPIPYEFESYDVWHRRRVMEIKPGITGLWQVKGRSSTSFDEMVRLDIKYMTEWSLWMDVKILIMTPLAVVFSKGAY